MKERIVLAYSGGLGATVAAAWLAETYGAEIVAVTIDLGQGRELEEARDRALAAGAVRAHVLDGREEFARDYVLPALQAGALYGGRCPMAAALGRPLIAKKLIEVAQIEQATAVAHGCTGAGPDHVRLEAAARALDPEIRVIVPGREWTMTRQEEMAYARRRHIPMGATADTPYRTDTNLWGRWIECGALDDPWIEPPEDVYAVTKPPAGAPNTPAHVEIAFARGVPVAINGVAMALTELIDSLSIIAGQHGVGRIDFVEHRPGGITSRTICEAPAAVVLHAAHQELARLVSPVELDRLTRDLSVRYADLVGGGLWFSPMREALDAFTAKVQERVTGVVRVRLFQGQHTIVGRKSPLYDRGCGPSGDPFDDAAASGFATIAGLPLEAAARTPAPGAASPAPVIET